MFVLAGFVSLISTLVCVVLYGVVLVETFKYSPVLGAVMFAASAWIVRKFASLIRAAVKAVTGPL